MSSLPRMLASIDLPPMLEAPKATSFTHDGTVRVTGCDGPGPCVRVMREMPGIYSAMAHSAEPRAATNGPRVPRVWTHPGRGSPERSVQ